MLLLFYFTSQAQLYEDRGENKMGDNIEKKTGSSSDENYVKWQQRRGNQVHQATRANEGEKL